MRKYVSAVQVTQNITLSISLWCCVMEPLVNHYARSMKPHNSSFVLLGNLQHIIQNSLLHLEVDEENQN